METRLQQFTAAQLRTIVIHEMRKFAQALEYGSTISDLQEIREQIRLLADTLAEKEREEAASYFVESPLRSGLTPSM